MLRTVFSDKPIVLWTLTLRGFGSELSLLLLAKVYSRMMDYRFYVHSKGWNFRHTHGWSDYFEPAFDEVGGDLRVFSYYDRGFVDSLKKKTVKLGLSVAYGAEVKPQWDLFGHLWNPNFEALVTAKWPEISFWSALHRDFSEIWRLKAPVAHQVALNVSQLFRGKSFAPSDCLAVHVRRGDKAQEAKVWQVAEYVPHIERMNPKALVVLTDDFRVVPELRRLTGLDVVTTCLPQKHGHDQSTFNALTATDRQTEFIDLLTDLRLAAEAGSYLGTVSSNITRIVYLLRGLKGVHAIDKTQISFWG
jgi:hypothetical protein